MRTITPELYLLEGAVCNIYLFPAASLLIDSGMSGDLPRILAQLKEANCRPQFLLITHCHPDHVGSAVGLVKEFGLKVLAHQDEVPYLNGTRSLQTSSRFMNFLTWLSDRLNIKSPALPVDQALREGGTVAGFQILHTPGHTPGCLTLYQPERQLAICGDALFNRNPFTRKEGLRLPPPLLTWDGTAARRSAARLADLPLQVLCCGHGEAILSGAAEQIKAILKTA